ncbi:MAG TPA: hypothetical protein VMW62_03535 [Chloroflexota bacterium]|nr:hypothetical protein [Chloroflexota bacterium]
MKALKTARKPEPLVPYHRLLSLRGQIDEIDAALRSDRHFCATGRLQLPPMALIALRQAVHAELETAEHQWQASHRGAAARAA